jgi:hypothetical protein
VNHNDQQQPDDCFREVLQRLISRSLT